MVEGRSPTSRSQQGPGTSWIVDEREQPGLPPWWFLLSVVSMGVAVAAATITLGTFRGGLLPAEGLFLDSGGAWRVGFDLLGLNTVRVMIGITAGATVVATGFVARRFSHSAGIGILAAGLVALDPGLLLEGQIAVPAALLRFAAIASLALAIGGHPVYHWLLPIPIIVGALLEPRFLLWGVAMSTILLFRGHIFAAPKHLAGALLLGTIIPLVVVLPLMIAVDQTLGHHAVVCATATWKSLLLIEVPDYGRQAVAVANPLVAVGGLGLLAGLALYGLSQIIFSFRLARLPGRIQVRLPGRLPRTASRSLWLGALALLMPTPHAALVLGAVAIGIAVQAVTEDAPSFGWTVGFVLIALSIIVLVRVWPLVLGEPSLGDVNRIFDWLPWVDDVRCMQA